MITYGLSTTKKVLEYSYKLGDKGKCQILLGFVEICLITREPPSLFDVGCSYLVQ